MRVRIYPNKKQLKMIHQSFGCVRFVYRTMAVGSDGQEYHSPNYLKEIESKHKYYQRQQAKCKKGSRTFKNKITNIKKDFLHKLSLNLVKNHDLISVENLQIKNMVKNHKLARSILNMNWGEFFRLLEYKCDWYGKHFLRVVLQKFPDPQMSQIGR